MIHWCGTGLSAVPGLRRLISDGYPITVWNRTARKAEAAVGDLTDAVRAFTPEALAAEVKSGDIVVSMLPGDWHIPLARMCIATRAHFISSSYVSPEMRALDEDAREAGVVLMNEVGLDPGIDHLMAHWLVADYLAHGDHAPEDRLHFISYCGGVPKVPNPFRYKFSWSPLGVLKALRSPSRSISHGAVLDVARPWDAISRYTAPLPAPEEFEVYPNRDSLPFLEDYRFERDWEVDTFVRGTLRLDGWAEAWAEVFAEIETLEGAEGEARLQEMSDRFWAENAYHEDEPDRVVLCVGLRAERGSIPVYDKTFTLDAWGDTRGSAMARLVSETVGLGVRSIAAGQILAGVSTVPHAQIVVREWLETVEREAQHLSVVDALA